MSNEISTDIRDELKSDQFDRQNQALDTIEKLIIEGKREALFYPEAMFECAATAPHFIKLRVWRLLKSLTNEWPAELAEYDEAFGRGIASEHQGIRQNALDALLRLIKEKQKPLALDPAHLRTGLNKGESKTEFREDLVYLSGFVPSADTVELLVELTDIEVGSVEAQVPEALTTTESMAIKAVFSESYPKKDAAAEALRELTDTHTELLVEDANKIAGSLQRVPNPAAIADTLCSVVPEAEPQTLPRIVIHMVNTATDPETTADTRAEAHRVLQTTVSEFPRIGMALLTKQIQDEPAIELENESPKQARSRLNILCAALGVDTLHEFALIALPIQLRETPEHAEATFLSIIQRVSDVGVEPVIEIFDNINENNTLQEDYSAAVEAAVTELLSSELGDTDRANISNAVVPIAVYPSSSLGTKIISEAQRLHNAGDDKAFYTYLDCLEIIARKNSTALAKQVEYIVEWLGAPEPTVRERALGILYSIDPRAVTPFGNAVVDRLDDSNDIQIMACRVLQQLNIYPVPDELTELIYNGNSSELRSAAHTAMTKLTGRHTFPEPSADISLTTGVDGATSTSTIQYRPPDSDRWQTVAPTQAHKRILNQVSRWVQSGDSGTVALPGYQPRHLIMVLVEALFSLATQAPEVAVYSPIWRNRWGTKGDLEEEYCRYAVSTEDNPHDVSPLNKLFSTARVTSDGDIKKNVGEPRWDGCVPLAKYPSDLSKLDDPDAIILNFTSIRKEDDENIFETIRDQRPDTAVIAVYSMFTERKREYYPNFNPIELESTEGSVVRSVDRDNKGLVTTKASTTEWLDSLEDNDLPGHLTSIDASDAPGARRDNDSKSLLYADLVTENTQQSTLPNVRITPLDYDAVNDALDTVFSKVKSLENANLNYISNKLFYLRIRLERLPVKPEVHDNWIREQRLDGSRHVPDRIEERLEQFERYLDSISDPGATAPSREAILEFDTIIESLNDESPIFNRFIEYIEVGRNTSARIILFCHKQTWASMVRENITDLLEISESDLDSWGIKIVGPRVLRELENFDLMVIPGPLRPSMQSYYCYPGVEAVEVLTYGNRWTRKIDQVASDQAETVSQYLREDTEEFPSPRVIKGPWEEDTTESSEAPAASQDTMEAPSSQDRLVQAFHSATVEEGQSTAPIEDERVTYEIETEESITYTTPGYDRVLRKKQETNDSVSAYHWVSPGVLAPGDTMIRIGDVQQQRLWEEHIKEVWKGQERNESVEKITTGLRLWYKTISAIVKEARDVLTDPTQDRITELLAEEVQRAGSDRGEGTIEQWFDGVIEGDKSMDLVHNPSLRIGPRDYEDIQYIGKAFEKDQLIKYGEYIEAAMRAFRTINRQEGTNFKAKLINDLMSDESSEVSEAATRHTVSEVSIIDGLEDEDEIGKDDADLDDSNEEMNQVSDGVVEGDDVGGAED